MIEHLADELSAYVDDELSPAERARVERHVAACVACAGALDGLRLVAARARQVTDREPSPAAADAIWQGIAESARFRDRSGSGSTSLATPTATRVTPLDGSRRRTVTLSVRQLLAAGIAIALLSGGVVWRAVRQGTETSSPRIAQHRDTGRAPDALDRVTISSPDDGVADIRGAPTVAGRTGGGRSPAVLARRVPSVAPIDRATPQYAAAVGELERELARHRSRLDPATVRAIEESLATIDRAIGQARAALADDPGNAYLNDHLASTMARKLKLLRDAASVAGAQS